MKNNTVRGFIVGIITASLIVGSSATYVSVNNNKKYDELYSKIEAIENEKNVVISSNNTVSATAERLGTSETTIGSFQSSLETESAERKTSDSKISQSIGTEIETLKGYIGTASINNIADGTIKGAIGNTSIVGIGSSNNITSAISSLNSDIIASKTNITLNNTEISDMKKILDSNMAKMNSYLSDRGVVSNTLMETVYQGIYTYDKNASYNPNPNTMGVIYTKCLSGNNGNTNVSVRLLINTAYELYISTYISGVSWGTWVKV